MDVFNISNVQGPKGPEDRGGVGRTAGSQKGERARRTTTTGDSFAHSEKASQIKALVESLKADTGIRSELVEKFKALMELGELDSAEAAERAAAALLQTDDQG